MTLGVVLGFILLLLIISHVGFILLNSTYKKKKENVFICKVQDNPLIHIQNDLIKTS